MKSLGIRSFACILILMSCMAVSCGQPKTKRIFYLNSYHQGYKSSDEVMDGIKEVFSKEQIDLSVFFLDTKRKTAPQEIQTSIAMALTKIGSFDPDLIIASDDDAVKYVIVPHFKNSSIPVVFCGVNWSASQYGLPHANITGMLEVLPLAENLAIMKTYFPKARKLVVLSENSLSEKNNTDILDTLYKRQGFQVTYRLVDHFEDWKLAFKEANERSDIIYLPTNGAIKGWNTEEAKTFIARHIKKPAITCDDFMMPYSVYGLTKVAKEQGLWAAQTALQILGGRTPSGISLQRNAQSKSFINAYLAKKVGFAPKTELTALSEVLIFNY